MLDLKAQLAAAGIVTAEQVKAFDEKEAKAKKAREAKAQQRKSGSQRGKGNGGASQGGRGNQAKSRNHRPSKGRGKGQHRGKGQGRSSVEELKAMGRGEAYDRIRKIVAHSRLDDKERTIPLADDKTFNFVTSTGSIGRLYLTEATVDSLKNGKSAISSFMSNHGLSHCVLPKEIALDLAKVFPLWLRHLRGHEPIIEVPEASAASESGAENKAPEAKVDTAKNEAGTAQETKANAGESEESPPAPKVEASTAQEVEDAGA